MGWYLRACEIDIELCRLYIKIWNECKKICTIFLLKKYKQDNREIHSFENKENNYINTERWAIPISGPDKPTACRATGAREYQKRGSKRRTANFTPARRHPRRFRNKNLANSLIWLYCATESANFFCSTGAEFTTIDRSAGNADAGRKRRRRKTRHHKTKCININIIFLFPPLPFLLKYILIEQ